MEKKKLLLVAISVGVFLVIIISASILIFTPKTETGTAFSSSRPITAGSGRTISQERPASVDISDMVKNSDSLRGIQVAPSATASQETNVIINGEQPKTSLTVEKTDDTTSAKVTISIPTPSAPAVSAPAEPAPAPSRVTVAPRQTASTPAAKAAPSTPKAAPGSTARPVAKTAAATPAAKPAKSDSSRTRNDYWVQTGAFSTQIRAEGVRETLAEKGIVSIIENRIVDGKTWYRVRVGPYTSETEANYWLSLVKSIDGFADSQVRQTRSLQ
jgi:DedD protein